jgi:DNA-directed RNA polymerase subunit M/transcription elongation factor TFIIS
MSSESLFCRDCGAFLDISRSTSSKVGCSRCPYSVSLNQYCGSYTRVSSSRAKIDYNALYSKLSSGEARASVHEACPKCQHGVSWFKSVQMRSADEGETVFYECQVSRAAAALLETASPILVVAGVRSQVEPEQLRRFP